MLYAPLYVNDKALSFHQVQKHPVQLHYSSTEQPELFISHSVTVRRREGLKENSLGESGSEPSVEFVLVKSFRSFSVT